MIGLSILSGSHLELVPEVIAAAARPRASTPRSSSAGSSPRRTGPGSLAAGVAAVYTPKDFELGRIMGEITGFTEERRAAVETDGPAPGCAGCGADRAAQGARVVVAAGGGAAGGTVRRWPAWILFGSVMPLAAARSAMAMPSLLAMPCRLSPCCTS